MYVRGLHRYLSRGRERVVQLHRWSSMSRAAAICKGGQEARRGMAGHGTAGHTRYNHAL